MMINFLVQFHSGWRWIVIAVAVVTLVVLAMTWFRNEQTSQRDRKFMAAFTGVVDTQILIGLILIAVLASVGNFQGYQIEHAATMLISAALLHVSAIWRSRAPAVRARNNFFLILAVLALIIVGISRLPQGWTMG